MIYAGDPFGSPVSAGAMVRAVEWLQGTLLGTIATTVAIIAIAAIGLAMLWGRIELRRGATVVLGCFVLFGASSIAAGIMLAAGSVEGGSYELVPDWSARTPSPPQTRPPVAYDPYAGAAMPTR